jgi:pimeloyl-ACP methyl ester carboxylesterase
MGATSAMYGESFRQIDSVRYPNWPEYRNETTIYHLAMRVIKEHGIADGDIVGGSSLGGMVAAEIAHHINLQRIVLIGSTTTPDKISPVMKTLSNFVDFAPLKLVQLFTGKVSSVMEARLFEMFSQTHPDFIKNMSRAVFEWQGNRNPACPVSAIHGDRDRVIYPPDSETAIIAGGGHLIAITHERQVVDFLIGEIEPTT